EGRDVPQPDARRDLQPSLPRQAGIRSDAARVGEDDDPEVLEDEVGPETQLAGEQRGSVPADRGIRSVVALIVRRPADLGPLAIRRIAALVALPAAEEPLGERARLRILVAALQDDRAVLRPGGEDQPGCK